MEQKSHFKIQSETDLNAEELCALYNAVHWSIYTKDSSKLKSALDGSHFVVTARHQDELIGLARCICDGVSVAYLQDILVHPDHQRKGIGRSLMLACMEHYNDIRQMILLTDDRAEQLAFYSSLGFSNTRELKKMPLNAFVRYKGIELS